MFPQRSDNESSLPTVLPHLSDEHTTILDNFGLIDVAVLCERSKKGLSAEEIKGEKIQESLQRSDKVLQILISETKAALNGGLRSSFGAYVVALPQWKPLLGENPTPESVLDCLEKFRAGIATMQTFPDLSPKLPDIMDVILRLSKTVMQISSENSRPRY